MKRKENIKVLREHLKRNVLSMLEEYNFGFLHLKSKIKNQMLNEKGGKQIVYNTLTGINKLEILLKSILKTVETAYKSLTTEPEQRESFSHHLVNAVTNHLEIMDKNFDASNNAASALGSPERETTTNLDEAATNVDIKFDNGKFDDDGILKPSYEDSKPEEKTEEEAKREAFGIPGKDETGADDAFDVFNKIETQISDTYARLRNKLDRTVFKQWLPKNLQAYMDAWNEEISNTLSKIDV